MAAMSFMDSRGRHKPRGFPYRQLTVLAICRICEPIAFMSIFPYIYYMIKSFNVTDDERRIALYAGMVTSSFAFAEALSSAIWGRLSDKFGRKPILLCGLAGTGISMVATGFATNLPAVLIARALGGLLNGNIGVLQTTVAEVVTEEAHQAHAFAIMPSVWCIGAIIGSALGGALADPVHNYPSLFRSGTIFSEYPYLLPNLVCALVVLISMTVGILFLEETHEDLQTRTDVGLQFGNRIVALVRPKLSRTQKGTERSFDSETLALLHEEDLPPDYQSSTSSPDLAATSIGLPPPYHAPDDESNATSTIANCSQQSSSKTSDLEAYRTKSDAGVWQAMTRQVLLNIVGYGIIAYHTISAEQLLPVMLSLPETETKTTLPFWFTGGFALPTRSIGSILSVQGLIQMVSTLVLFPMVNRRIGPLATFRLAVLSYPLLYLVVPYLTLLPPSIRIPAVYAVLVWKVTAQAFAFPSNNIMLANQLPRRALGTFNGVASSAASGSRAVGPTVSGFFQAAGLAHGMLGLPWWVNATVALVGSVLSLLMVEVKKKPVTLEKESEDVDVDHASTSFLISPGTNAALVVADTSGSPLEEMTFSPSSPTLNRISMDVRRNSHPLCRSQSS